MILWWKLTIICSIGVLDVHQIQVFFCNWFDTRKCCAIVERLMNNEIMMINRTRSNHSICAVIPTSKSSWSRKENFRKISITFAWILCTYTIGSLCSSYWTTSRTFLSLVYFLRVESLVNELLLEFFDGVQLCRAFEGFNIQFCMLLACWAQQIIVDKRLHI